MASYKNFYTNFSIGAHKALREPLSLDLAEDEYTEINIDDTPPSSPKSKGIKII